MFLILCYVIMLCAMIFWPMSCCTFHHMNEAERFGGGFLTQISIECENLLGGKCHSYGYALYTKSIIILNHDERINLVPTG